MVMFCFNSISDHNRQVFTSLKVHIGCITLWFIRGSRKHKDEAETSNRYGMKSEDVHLAEKGFGVEVVHIKGSV